MKGSADVIKVLNEVLRKELTGINQYFIHSKICKKLGLRCPRRARLERIDRRDETRRSAHGANSIS
jgi:bacterioferritin